jgi:hypothetical protein
MKSFCLLLWKHLLILKIVPKDPSKAFFCIPFLSMAAFGTIFRIIGGFRKYFLELQAVIKKPKEGYWKDFYN